MALTIEQKKAVVAEVADAANKALAAVKTPGGNQWRSLLSKRRQ